MTQFSIIVSCFTAKTKPKDNKNINPIFEYHVNMLDRTITNYDRQLGMQPKRCLEVL